MSYSLRFALIVAFSILIVGPAGAEDTAAQPWNADLKLTVFGGPSAGRITLSLNGEFLAEFDDDPPIMTDVADLVRPGENELSIQVDAAAPGRSGRDLRLAVAQVQQVTRRQMETKLPLIHMTIPARIDGGACTETIRFWAGPVEGAAQLKNMHWLVIDGPPMRHMVSVTVNGRTVVETLEGDSYYDISQHVIKGKNEVEYTTRETCLARAIDTDENLEIFVTTVEERGDAMEMTGPPSAVFRLSRDLKKERVVRRTAFRGR